MAETSRGAFGAQECRLAVGGLAAARRPSAPDQAADRLRCRRSIWALERRHDDESAALQRLLMQLSGRQTKRHRAITTSGMLAGLWVLQAAVGPLAHYGADRLNAMLEKHLPLFFATVKKVCIPL